MHLAGYIVTYAILLGCGALCAMKGKLWFVALGVLLPILWIVGAVRPAKPNSSWAKNVSGL
jgi:lysyl-tRNA synthetase class 2